MLTPCMHLGVQHPPGEGLLPTHHAGRPHYQMDTLFLIWGQKTHQRRAYLQFKPNVFIVGPSKPQQVHVLHLFSYSPRTIAV